MKTVMRNTIPGSVVDPQQSDFGTEAEWLGRPARFLLEDLLVAKGRLARQTKMVRASIRKAKNRRPRRQDHPVLRYHECAVYRAQRFLAECQHAPTAAQVKRAKASARERLKVDKELGCCLDGCGERIVG